MQEQLVTFETAKLAENKGFDIIKSDDKFYDFSGNLDYTFQGYQESLEKYERTSAPTQSLLQKWLRDEHQIHIEVELYDNSRTYHWEYRVITSKDRDWNDVDCFDSAKRHYNREEFGTFEKALEQGLQESLKLIGNEKD